MAVLYETLTRLWSGMKNDLVKAFGDQTYQETFLWKHFPKEVTGGRQVELRFRTARNYVSGARKGQEQLPVGGTRKAVETTMPIKWNYFPLQLDGIQVRLARKDKDALVNLFGDSFEDRLITSKFDLERQAWNAEDGRIAQINGAPTVGTPSGHTTIVLNNCVIDHFKVGMYLEFVSSGGTDRGSANVVTVDEDNLTIIVDSATLTGLADDDYVYNDGVYISDYDKEILGLLAHVSATNPTGGTYQGKDRTAAGYEFLKANVLANSGTPRIITRKLMRDALRAARRKGGKITKVFCSPGVRESFIQLLETLNTPNNTIVDSTGSSGTLKFHWDGGALELEDSIMCPANKLFFLDMSTFKIKENTPIGWDPLLPTRLSGVKDYDHIWGRMIHGGELTCNSPHKNVLLDDITEDDGIA